MPVKFTVVWAVCEPRKALTAGVMFTYCDLLTMMFITHLPVVYVQDSFYAFLFFKTRFLHVGGSGQDWLNTFIFLSLAIEVGL
jgi:uncharacterized membrane protein YkgB